jgi:hypothetical protein
MFCMSEIPPCRITRRFVAVVSSILFLVVPICLDLHHSCDLHGHPRNSAGSSILRNYDGHSAKEEIRDFCLSCALLRTLLADDDVRVTHTTGPATSFAGRMDPESPIEGLRCEGPPPSRAPPLHRTAPSA